MTGEYQHALDNKGRIFIPAKLRDEIGQAAYVTLSMDRCLSVYSEESWNGLVEKVNALPYVRQRKMRPLFAHAVRDGIGMHEPLIAVHNEMRGPFALGRVGIERAHLINAVDLFELLI